MGCGCNKGRTTQAPGATQAARRITVYQVIGTDGAVVAEYGNLQEARKKAVEVTGRVKVTTQTAPAAATV